MIFNMSVNHEGLDLNLLRVFHRIYVQQSLTGAAAQLGHTQSALSHSLKKMRLIFKDDLFIRAKGGLVPTPRADALFESIDQVLSTIEREITPKTHFEPSTSKRHFSISLNDLAEVAFFRPLFPFAQEHAPGCSFSTHRISNENVAAALESGAVDLAIGIFPHVSPNFYQQKLFESDYVVLACSDHPRIGSQLTWQDYAAEEHIVVSSGSDHYFQKNTLEPLGIRRKFHLTTEGFLSIPWLLKGTHLIATVPTYISDSLAQAASVKQLKLPKSLPYRLQSMWHPRSHSDSGHRWLREAIFSLMKDPARL